MELSIKTLRSRLDAFLSDRGVVHYRHGAGLAPTLALSELYDAFGEFARAETYALVHEAREKRRSDPDAVRRLGALLAFVAAQVEDAHASEAIETISRLEVSGQVAVPPGTESFADAVNALPLEPSRQKRDLLEQAISGFLFENQRPYAVRRESALHTARALGASSYVGLQSQLSGIDYPGLVGQCEEVLRRTEDAYRDVLGYVLRKLDPELKPRPNGTARRHDLLRAAVAPWLLEHFRREELLPTAMRCVEELGFHPNANGRIQLDTDDRPGKSPRAFVADVHVPDDIRLVVRPGQGLDDYFSLLHEYGHALHLAHTSRSLSPEDRRLGDASVTESFAFLFDHFLIDERWHRRFLRLSQTQARDAARVAAFNNLVLLRRYCARLPYELSLYERGPVRELAEEYEERQTAALFVAVPKGMFLYDVDAQLYSARYLRAWALEATWHRVLRERFDEDFWRNPATGRWLVTLFDRGQQDGAEALSREFSGAPLDLRHAGERLVAVLNR